MTTFTHPNDETLDLWLDGSLTGPPAEALEDHVGGCPLCAQRLFRGARREAMFVEAAAAMARDDAPRADDAWHPAAEQAAQQPARSLPDPTTPPPGSLMQVATPQPPANRRPWAALAAVVATAAAAAIILRPAPAPDLPAYVAMEVQGAAQMRSAPAAGTTTLDGGYTLLLRPQVSGPDVDLQARVFALSDGSAVELSPEVTVAASGSVRVVEDAVRGTPIGTAGDKVLVVAVAPVGEPLDEADRRALLSREPTAEGWQFHYGTLTVTAP